jgi:uncharacterized iron-regulated membrane protein
MSTKKVLTLAHRWVGLALAALVLLQAGTGLLLINKDALEPLIHPEVRVNAGGAAPLDKVVAAIHAAHPDLRLDRIYTPERADRALAARVLDDKRAMTILLVDPGSAKVLSSGPLSSYPLQLAERLHVSLLQGASGQIVLLVEGVLLLFMAISGLIVWWPKLKLLGQALRIHTGAGSRRLLRDLHLVPGALAAVFIAVSAFTGAGMIAEPILKAAVGAFAPVSPDLALPKMAPLAPSQQLTTAQSALDQLNARFPDGRLRQIRFFGPDERLVGVVMESRTALNPRAHHLAAVDRADGQLTVWEDGDRQLRGDAILAWLLPIHTGEVLGWARNGLMSLVALTLILLTVSGVWMWAAKPRRNRRR